MQAASTSATAQPVGGKLTVQNDRRRAGLLLHPTSLPGRFGSGDFSHEAYRFIEFLAASGISVWQTLPLGPTHNDGSPYQCLSAHAGNPLLISLDWLCDRGWLAREALNDVDGRAQQRLSCLRAAYQTYLQKANAAERDALAQFSQDNAYWLDDFALFTALREEQDRHCWMKWPVPLRDRESKAMQAATQRLGDVMMQIRFEQFVFFQQWIELKRYANQRDIRLFGDMPIFVAHDSADVWAHRELFLLDDKGFATVVAGVPPDYFSATGQRWGNPLYNWQRMQQDGFNWWIDRMRTQLQQFDLIRIDHFRGFEAYWEIPAKALTAIDGRWIKAPGDALLQALYQRFGDLPLVAEDLGIITAEVTALREKWQLPGMKILHFAFDSDAANVYLPHHHERNSVVYTGTHDNDTTVSWYNMLPEQTQQRIREYLNYPEQQAMPWPLLRCAFASVSNLAVVPMQDVLALGTGHRMNLPGTTKDNWRWRYKWEQMPADLSQRLRQLLQLYGRT